MKKISVAIATYNEARNISKCLESINSWVDEIVIVDGSSSDETVKICKKYNTKIIETDNPPIFHINKQKAIDAGEGEWILQLDADETVTPELANEIKKIINGASSKDGYAVPRKNYLLGKWMKKGGLYPDFVIRLFKKNKGNLPCKSVHEQIKIRGETGNLTNPLIHFPYPSFSDYLKKADIYTTLSANEYLKEELNLNISSFFKFMFYIPVIIFLRIYIRHLGIYDGFPGFVWAFFSALHYPVSYIKYWEIKNNNDYSSY